MRLIKLDYINFYISIRKRLNINNIENLSSAQINYLENLYKKNIYFHNYKKQIFLRWFTKNNESTIDFFKKTNKLIKKLNIKLNDFEKEKINNIESREFTKRRALKLIEVPYKNNKKDLFLINAYFFYKEIRIFSKNINLFTLDYMAEIYITLKELVLYDPKEDKILKVISYNNIKEIILKSYVIQLKIIGHKDLFIKYKDNEIIYISLYRILSKKNIKFKNEITKENIFKKNIINFF